MELNNVILKKVYPITKVSPKFVKREIEVETLGSYPQLLTIEIHNDKCKDYESIALNSMINLRIDLRGHEWTNSQGNRRVINTIVAWSVTNLTPPIPAQAPAPATVTTSDNLPF